jgi:PHD/YefM family antitoxin component YafN of YafNO toxin-antitoxin module
MNRIDLLDLPEAMRDLVRACAAQGARTIFERETRPVAILISYDEYLALRETIDIANDSLLYARLEQAEEEGRTGRVLAVEGLLGV